MIELKNPFGWSGELEKSFQESKEAMIRECKAWIQNCIPASWTCLAIGWSKLGIGYWLSQKCCVRLSNQSDVTVITVKLFEYVVEGHKA